MAEEDWDRIYEAVPGVLAQMKACGGRDTEKTLYGESSGWEQKKGMAGLS